MGGRPVRPRVTLRIKVRLSALGEGVKPFGSILAIRKRSMLVSDCESFFGFGISDLIGAFKDQRSSLSPLNIFLIGFSGSVNALPMFFLGAFEEATNATGYFSTL